MALSPDEKEIRWVGSSEDADHIKVGQDIAAARYRGGLVARFARAASAHLLVQDRRACEACKDEADHLGAIEPGVEHVDRHQNLRERLLLSRARVSACFLVTAKTIALPSSGLLSAPLASM